MTDDNKNKSTLTLSGSQLRDAKETISQGGHKVRQQFSHGRTNAVTVVKKRNINETAKPGAGAPAQRAPRDPNVVRDLATQDAPKRVGMGAPRTGGIKRPERPDRLERPARSDGPRGDQPRNDQPREQQRSDSNSNAQRGPRPPRRDDGPRNLNQSEQLKRARVLREAQQSDSTRPSRPNFNQARDQIGRPSFQRPTTVAYSDTDEKRRRTADASAQKAAAKLDSLGMADDRNDARPSKEAPSKRSTSGGKDRRGGRITVTQALDDSFAEGRVMSDAARRRKLQKRNRRNDSDPREKITREVTIPDTITVQELASRMSEPAGMVVKTLMKNGVMATINQVIDADTAELIATELGHKVVRVSESDVLAGLGEWETSEDDLISRPPVVTIMGHVDHGKTSLLDAIRTTDVVSGEAGGITQHIGAYQVTMKSGQKITFLDTPGHAAFTEMRARGANVTDIVVLVVAADDSIMPQTVEAISHAKAAKVPMVVAINKIDKPDANPQKVRNELLQHNVQVEEMGGDVLAVEVSAKQKLNLEKLEEAILLQSEILDLRANPNRPAKATVVEAKLQTGRGAVATVLIQDGTLRVGDIFVTGTESGRVRALHNDHGKNIKEALPGQPVEVIGLSGVPNAGDDFVVVENDDKAREVAEFRIRKKRELANLATKKSTLENMFSNMQSGAQKELAIIVKGDVHGSVEAIAGSLAKVAEDNAEVSARIIHTGVGAINESDITLANASNAMVVGFNVRANPQARDVAKRDGVDIRYYSVIYDIMDDVKGMLSGMLSPTLREKFLGNAEIRQVINITKVGKIAGCMVTEGMVKRGAKVRLLRDDVVIHDGTLKTLKRFKDEVREVKDGFECGMAFENYEDIREGDKIEAYEIVEEARAL